MVYAFVIMFLTLNVMSTNACLEERLSVSIVWSCEPKMPLGCRDTKYKNESCTTCNSAFALKE